MDSPLSNTSILEKKINSKSNKYQQKDHFNKNTGNKSDYKNS